MRMKTILALAAAALLAACAGNPWSAASVPPGTARADVLARAGQPTRVVDLSGGGQRLQYSLQPYGRAAYMVDLDAAGRVVRSRQVLRQAEFERIQPGWTRADVEREFGPPAQVGGVASFRGQVLTYLWLDGNDRMFYWVYVDPLGIVQRAHPGMEFVNAPDERR